MKTDIDRDARAYLAGLSRVQFLTMPFKSQVISMIRRFDVGTTFTVDDIYPHVAEPLHHNQWGEALNEAHRIGLIEEAGFVKSKRRESKGRRVIQWQRVEQPQGELL